MAEIPQLPPMAGAGAAYSSVKKAAKSVRAAVRGYEEYVDKNGKKIRVYGGLNGMTPSEHDDWWHARGKYARPAKKTSPPLRRSLRIKERKERESKRRASMGGSRKTRKNGKSRKSRK